VLITSKVPMCIGCIGYLMLNERCGHMNGEFEMGNEAVIANF
jgi:hypothetical protein